MAQNAPTLGWLDRLIEKAMGRLLVKLYPELHLARDDFDRIILAHGVGRFWLAHLKLMRLGMMVFFVGAMVTGVLGAYLAKRALPVTEPWLVWVVVITGGLSGFVLPFVVLYLLTRRAKRQIHLYLLRGFDVPICPSCGYSMRGHASMRPLICPECGAVICE